MYNTYINNIHFNTVCLVISGEGFSANLSAGYIDMLAL